jgi:hypothetical protein
LFAAFLAAFLIETLGRLEENPTATLLDVMVYQTQMMRNETLPPYRRVPFTPSRQIVAVNVLLFASLALILVVAFISMLVKGWIREFDRGLAAIENPRHRALLREYRYLGLEQWKLLEMIHLLPTLIYLSLFLFFCGLSLFLLDIKATCGSVIAAIFALGVLFYIATAVIATLDDSAPFRSPLSRALSHHFRRLHSALHRDSTLWQRYLAISANTAYSSTIRALFYYLAKMARWKPFSEKGLCGEDGDPIWNEQDIATSSAVINILYTSSRGSRELAQSIILAGDPAHTLNSVRAYILLCRWAPHLDEVTPQAARVIGLLVCRTRDTSLRLVFNNEYVDCSLPVLMGSHEPWDQLLACLIQSQLPEHHNAARSLQLTHKHVLEAIHMMEIAPQRVLLIVRYLGLTVLPAAEPETKAAAVRILSALMSQLHATRDLPEHEQLVNAILQVFATINGIQLPCAYPHSVLSEFPSFPCHVYNPGILSQIINPTQLRIQATCLPAYREFARTLIEWLSYRSAYIQLDFLIPLELPLSSLEEMALDPPSYSLNNLRFAALLIGALISGSGGFALDFLNSNNEDLELEEVILLYDSYLIDRNVMPSLPIQNLLRWRNLRDWDQPLDIEVRHPWLALHKYTLAMEIIPHDLIATLEWSETPAINMIACDRLALYYSRTVPTEPPLISLFLSSSSYETILGAFQWHVNLIAGPLDTGSGPYEAPLRNIELENIMTILFVSNLDEHCITSSWILLLNTIVPLWPRLPDVFKQGFVTEFFKHDIDMQSPAIKQGVCLGIAWLECLWSTVLAPLVGAVYVDKVDMDLDIQELYDRNTGWSGPIEMEPDPDAILPAAYLYDIETREERHQQERARRGILLRSVDEVFSTVAALLETAHGAKVLSINAIARLHASPLMSHSRLLQDASSLQRIASIIDYHRPHISPLPEPTPQEDELISNLKTVDST